MRNFILRRLLQTLPMLLLASLIIFMLFAKTPGDFIDGNITLTAARAAELIIYGHSRFCNTDFDDKLACLNLSGV